MRRLLIIFSLWFVSLTSHAQTIREHYTKDKDSLQIGQAFFLPYNDKGYTLILPESKKINGLLLSLEDRKFNFEKASEESLIHPYALKEGLAVIYLSTGIPVDLFFDEASLEYVDHTLEKILNEHNLPNQNIFLFGTMVAGHRALKYIEYCKKGKSVFNPQIKGAVISESAIDWVRMWYEGQKQVRDHMNEVKFFEGNLITFLFDKNIGQTPGENMQTYVDFSPYTYFDPKMEKAKYFKDLALRAYTFAPTNYWFTANGNGVYDCNFPDMSGFINEQKLTGNNKAELIVYSNEKREKATQMEVQSHTWNLVDKKELVEWIMNEIRSAEVE